MQKPRNSRNPSERRTLGDHLRKRRLDLCLLQQDVGRHLSVTACTVKNWELGHTSPETRHRPSIHDFFGYQPLDPGGSFAYATGTFSSRRIALKLEEGVVFRVLRAENYPAHRTISEFRLQNFKEFESLSMQVVRIAHEVGLMKLGTIAIDGTKIKANASKHKAMSHGRMLKEEQRLKQEIHGLTKRASQQVVREDCLYGAEFRGDENPAELSRRNERLTRIKAARERLEARQAEEDRRAGRKPGDDMDRPAGKRGRISSENSVKCRRRSKRISQIPNPGS